MRMHTFKPHPKIYIYESKYGVAVLVKQYIKLEWPYLIVVCIQDSDNFYLSERGSQT